MTARLAAIAVLLVAAPAAVSAQAPVASVRWVEIDVGGGLLGGGHLGSADANLRANDRTERAYRLFGTDSEFARAPHWHIRAARRLWSRWSVEGGIAMSRPVLRTDIGSDIEGGPGLTASETVDQYVIDAGVVAAFHELRLGRLTPYAAAGGGYLRQLHEGQTVIEHGQVLHAGGGVRYPLMERAAGLVRTLGLRGDVRAYVMRGGVSVEDAPRPHVAISGSVLVGF